MPYPRNGEKPHESKIMLYYTVAVLIIAIGALIWNNGGQIKAFFEL